MKSFAKFALVALTVSVVATSFGCDKKETEEAQPVDATVVTQEQQPTAAPTEEAAAH